MSSQYLLFGWVESGNFECIKEAIAQKWAIIPQKAFDNFNRPFYSFQKSEPSLGDVEFNQNWTLNIYDLQYSIQVRRNVLNTTPNTEVRELLPITIYFELFSRMNNRTSLPMQESLVQLCNIIEPEVIISMVEESFYDNDMYVGKDYVFPSINGLYDNCRGLFYASDQLNIYRKAISSQDLYRKIITQKGILSVGPFGVSSTNEDPTIFADNFGHYLQDGILKDILLDKFEAHMYALKIILLDLQYSLV